MITSEIKKIKLLAFVQRCNRLQQLCLVNISNMFDDSKVFKFMF